MKQKIIIIFICLAITFSMNAQNKLIYVGDPMCSWCYGFAPQLEKLVEKYKDQLEIELVTGGLRPYNKQSIFELKDFLTGHWQEVNKRTQQPFSYGILDRKDLKYDTEPACRAVVVLRSINKAKEFEFFKLAQSAFYYENKNLGAVETYYPILEKLGVSKDVFSQKFNSEEYKKLVQQDFKRAGDLGVRGFPSVLLDIDGKISVVSRGYTTIEQLETAITNALQTD